MKKILLFLLTAFLLFSPLSGLLSTASAQGWSWAKTAGSNCEAYLVTTDPSGNVYGGGFSPDTLFWVKYDPSGAFLWKGYALGTGEYDLNGLATDPSGNLIVFGLFDYCDSIRIGGITLLRDSGEYFLAKISPSGSVLWATNFGKEMVNTLYTTQMSGFAGTRSQGAVTTDSAGNIYVSAVFDSASMYIGPYTLHNTDVTGTTADIFVAKFSPPGVVSWATSVGGTNSDYVQAITVSSNGNVYIAGGFCSPSLTVGSSVVSNPFYVPWPLTHLGYIAEFSSSGTPLWAQAVGGANGASGTSLAKDNSGNVYLAGSFYDNTVSFGPYTLSQPYLSAYSKEALFVVQYSAANLVTWGKAIGSATRGVGFYDVTFGDEGYRAPSVAVAPCGQVWISGSYNQDVKLDSGNILSFIPGADPVFIAGYNLAGGVVGKAALASGGDDMSQMTCDAAGNVFFCSDVLDSLVAGPDTLRFSTAYEGFYVAKYPAVVTPADTLYARYDTLVCADTSITLTAPAGYVIYRWDNGSTATTRTAPASGTYYVQCINNSCSAMRVDTFHVAIRSSPLVSLGNDTAICARDTLLLRSVQPAGSAYLWSSGSTVDSSKVSLSGTYWLQVTDSGCAAADTIHISVNARPAVNLGPDTTACAGSRIVLRSSVSYIAPTYLWRTGFATPADTAATAGAYWLQVTDGGCSGADTVRVSFTTNPVVSLGHDTTFCTGSRLVLRSAEPPGAAYLWNTGSMADTVIVSVSGTYWLQVNDSACTSTDTIHVVVNPIPVVNLGPDTTNCTGTPVTLRSSLSYTRPAYLWSDGHATSADAVTVGGTYWLQVTEGGCAGRDSINVRIIDDRLILSNQDTAICNGGAVQVAATSYNPGMTFGWSPTAGIALTTIANPLIVPDTSALYILTGTFPGCPNVLDSFFIDVEPYPQIHLGSARSVCDGDTIHIESNVSPAWYTHYFYNWSPITNLDASGATNVVFTAGSATMLKLTVSTPAGCRASDSVQININPGKFAFIDTIYAICPGDSVQLKDLVAPGTTVTHIWHPGSTLDDSDANSPWAYPLATTNYSAVVTSQYGCRETENVSVDVFPAAYMSFRDSVTIFPGENYLIDDQTNCVSFAWSPATGLSSASIASPVASPEQSTKYTVTGKTQWDCIVTDTIDVNVDPGILIAVPNAFTPDRSINANLYIITRGQVLLSYFRIFNRWGNKVFETNNLNTGWDGTYHNVPQPEDVFVYELEAATKSGTVFRKKGNITLIR